MEQIRFRLHLNTGSTIDVIVDENDVKEVDEDAMAEFLINQFNSDRPQWCRLGNVAFFTGAVTAIEVEAM